MSRNLWLMIGSAIVIFVLAIAIVLLRGGARIGNDAYAREYLNEGYTPVRSADASAGQVLDILKGPVRERALQAEALWRQQAALQPLEQADLDETFLASIEDPRRLLSRSTRVSLAAEFARYVRLRSQPTPGDYVAWVDGSDSYHWLTLGEAYSPRRFLEIYFDRAADESTSTRSVIGPLWSWLLGDNGHRIRRIGTGDRGIHTSIVLDRTGRLDFEPDDLTDPAAKERFHYFWAGAMKSQSAAFIAPNLSLADYVNAHDGAIAAESVFIAELANGQIVQVAVGFFYDERRGVWLIDSVVFQQSRGSHIIF